MKDKRLIFFSWDKNQEELLGLHSCFKKKKKLCQNRLIFCDVQCEIFLISYQTMQDLLNLKVVYEND